MSGVKGRSGRKGHYHELDIKSLLDKSYSIMMSFLDDENIPAEKKASFATAFLSKKIGERIDLQVTHVLTEDQINQITERIKELQQIGYITGPV